MTLPRFALNYNKYSKEELRELIMQRLHLTGREYKKSSKPDLVKRLHRLDITATFRLMDLPAELVEQILQYAIVYAPNFRRLSLVSKHLCCEVRSLFYKEADFEAASHGRIALQFRKPPIDLTLALRTSYRGVESRLQRNTGMTLAKSLMSWQYIYCHLRNLTLKVGAVVDMGANNFGGQQFGFIGGNSLLFMFCVFYAFVGVDNKLKTLKIKLETLGIVSTISKGAWLEALWPLKLLAGRFEIDLSVILQDSVEHIALSANDLDEQVVEMCKRFATCFFIVNESMDEEEDRSTVAIEGIDDLIFGLKLEELKDSWMSGYISTDNALEWIEFIDRVERNELKHRKHFRW